MKAIRPLTIIHDHEQLIIPKGDCQPSRIHFYRCSEVHFSFLLVEQVDVIRRAVEFDYALTRYVHLN